MQRERERETVLTYRTRIRTAHGLDIQRKMTRPPMDGMDGSTPASHRKDDLFRNHPPEFKYVAHRLDLDLVLAVLPPMTGSQCTGSMYNNLSNSPEKEDFSVRRVRVFFFFLVSAVKKKENAARAVH